jgi:hypothetical protein
MSDIGENSTCYLVAFQTSWCSEAGKGVGIFHIMTSQNLPCQATVPKPTLNWHFSFSRFLLLVTSYLTWPTVSQIYLDLSVFHFLKFLLLVTQ